MAIRHYVAALLIAGGAVSIHYGLGEDARLSAIDADINKRYKLVLRADEIERRLDTWVPLRRFTYPALLEEAQLLSDEHRKITGAPDFERMKMQYETAFSENAHNRIKYGMIPFGLGGLAIIIGSFTVLPLTKRELDEAQTASN